MQSIFTADNLISFIILVILEIVLGIDNVIFVSIIMNRMPKAQHFKARLIWISSGIVVRCCLLFALSWLLQQKGKPVFTLWNKGFDIASIVMICGGLFLLYKTVKEIHHKLEGEEESASANSTAQLNFGSGIAQIILIDTIFSFDSIITAGGTAKVLGVMIAAVVVAMIVMFLFSPKISSFIHKHPTLKMLSLSFLVMIGVVLIIEGWDSERAHEMQLKKLCLFCYGFFFRGRNAQYALAQKNIKNPVQLREPVLKEPDSK